MQRLIDLIRGLPGHPTHPPFTDMAIGAYTAGVVMLLVGLIGADEPEMAHGALLAIGFGLIATVPAALTGLIDWLALPKGSPARTLGTVHLLAMVSATVLFAIAFGVHVDGYLDGDVSAGAFVIAAFAEAVLLGGGYFGGTIVFVHGYRTLARPDSRPAEALSPTGHLGELSPVETAGPGRPPAPPGGEGPG